MAIKTFINGQENGVITFKDDTEPCAVYVNGERQDNISYIPTSAEGVDSATYTSEYKNNLRTLQVEGNTEQPSSANLFDQDQMVDGTKFTKEEYNGFDCIKVETKSNSLNCEFPVSIPSGKTVSMSLDYANSNGNIDFYTYLIYEDGTKSSVLVYRTSSTPSAEFVHREKTITTNQNVVALQFNFYGNYPAFYLKDIMLNIGNPLPYEPYIPPISIANSRTITNCGNGQIEVDVKGANLFALGESNYTVGKVHTNAGITYTVQADGGIRCKGTKTSSFSYFIFMGAYIRKYGQGTYSLGMYGENIPNKITIEFRRFNASGTSIQTGLASVGNPLTRTLVEGETLERFSVIVSTEGEVDFVVYPMLNIGEPLPYQPYFNSTVSIPANVVLESGANETLLELAKIGDIADTITIDRVNNEVKYIQRICRVRPFVNVGGVLNYEGYDSQYYNVDLWWFTLNKPAIPNVGKCEFAKVGTITETETDFCVEIGDIYMIIGIPKSLGITTPEALDSYLMQTGNSDLSIFYALETPIEWTVDNISDTELKAQFEDLSNSLLEWAKNTKNQTNIIEITSTPSVSKTSVNYAKWGGVPNENNT